MAKRTLLNTLNALIYRLPREGADVAHVLQQAGAKAHQAGTLLGAISDPAGGFLQGARALVEGRLGFEVVDGRVGLKVHAPDDPQEDDGHDGRDGR